ncbi:MAG: hypothetical protein JW850_08520 [Thermoflexales bacterium]|nr:hypothetical protein [Thermoflexales bacterium]
MRYLIGIDDTDNVDSRGTGFLARKLGASLESSGFARLLGITRHQLLVAPEIPYTSHNSSACLLVELQAGQAEGLAQVCREFLIQESAPGSDAGLCLSPWEAVGATTQAFGAQAKREVMSAALALDLARQAGLLLEGLTGTGCGVIGALAAVGLRAGGNDGRFIWLGGVRDVEGGRGDLGGVHLASALCAATGIEAICTPGGASIPPAASVELGGWVRPVLRGGEAVLLVEQVEEGRDDAWRVLSKAVIKNYSN